MIRTKIKMLLCTLIIIGSISTVWAASTGTGGSKGSGSINFDVKGKVTLIASNPDGSVPLVVDGTEYTLDGDDSHMGADGTGGFWDLLQNAALDQGSGEARILGHYNTKGQITVTGVILSR